MSERLPCKVFVAAYMPKHAIVVFAEPEIVNDTIADSSALVADVFDKPEYQVTPSDGLWMFEGTVGWTSGDPEGDEIDFVGEWRRPTDDEALAAACGENPCLAPCGT